VELESVPRLAEAELLAVREALRRTSVSLGPEPTAYASAWRRAAAREAVSVEAGEPYARAPRSTRGATRA
jgi:hypothetical protein